MKQYNIQLTDEMVLVIAAMRGLPVEWAASDVDVKALSAASVGAFVEGLLRAHPTIDRLRAEMKIEWKDRTAPGRIKSATTKPKTKRKIA